jgi:2-dehydro-3-deoxyphosphooctonate aldolase (KDO 8-P synthase)
MRGLAVMRDFGYPVVLDVTHSLQLPGGEGKQSGGQPQFIEPLARAGVAAGVDGVFMEVHDNPRRALSDGANALDLKKFGPLATRLRDLGRFVRKWHRS